MSPVNQSFGAGWGAVVPSSSGRGSGGGCVGGEGLIILADNFVRVFMDFNLLGDLKKRLKTLHKVTGLTENTPQDDVAIYRAWMQARRSSATGLDIGFHLSLHSI